MQGVAIVCIVLHNLLHLILPSAENEFSFSLELSRLFFSRLTETGIEAWKDVFSFLGWYGVPIFFFVSGYGLTLKYGSQPHINTPTHTFLWSHFKRLVLLMLIPYIPFMHIQLLNHDVQSVILQGTLLSNIFTPCNRLNPGVFWFFGAIWQFYILFAILRMFLFKKPKIGWWVLAVLNVICLAVMMVMTPNSSTLEQLRHNFIGWTLPFTMGIWAAQQPRWSALFDTPWKCVIIFLFGCIIIPLSNLNYYVWFFSPCFAVLASIALTKLLSNAGRIFKVSIWLGALSSFLFAIHPYTRFLCLKYISKEHLVLSYNILFYLLAAIVMALIYREIHNRLWTRKSR